MAEMEGVVGIGQFLRVHGLLGDALKVTPALAHRVVAGAPAVAAQLVPVGAEDAVEVSVHQIQLGKLVQESKIGFVGRRLSARVRDTMRRHRLCTVETRTADRSSGAAGGSRAAASNRWRNSPAAFLEKVQSASSAGSDRALQQQVDGAPDDGAGFAGAGAGDDQAAAPPGGPPRPAAGDPAAAANGGLSVRSNIPPGWPDAHRAIRVD